MTKAEQKNRRIIALQVFAAGTALTALGVLVQGLFGLILVVPGALVALIAVPVILFPKINAIELIGGIFPPY